MGEHLIWWLLAAVSLFWAMGAYNRLMRLRSQGVNAFAALEVCLRQYVELVKDNFPQGLTLLDGHDDEAIITWRALAAAADQFQVSLKVVQQQPLNAPTMKALITAFDTLLSCWLRLVALPTDLAGAAVPASLQSQWEQLGVQASLAKKEFNRNVENYNQAIDQFPAMLLAWAVDFKSAQMI
jgi:LemA protein